MRAAYRHTCTSVENLRKYHAKLIRVLALALFESEILQDSLPTMTILKAHVEQQDCKRGPLPDACLIRIETRSSNIAIVH